MTFSKFITILIISPIAAILILIFWEWLIIKLKLLKDILWIIAKRCNFIKYSISDRKQFSDIANGLWKIFIGKLKP